MDKTLLKGLAVLEAIAEMDGEARIIDAVAERVGLSRSNTHRTLQTLIHAGYIDRDLESGCYRGTAKMFALGARQLGQLDVRHIARPYMESLAEKSGETVHLSILERMEVIYVEKIEGSQPVRAYTMVGGRAPAHAVATGKALLSAMSSTYFENLPKELPRFTSATIVDMRLLRDELAKARSEEHTSELQSR